jgi:hypothetical protein
MNWTAIFIVIIGFVMVVIGWQGTYTNVWTVLGNTANSLSGGSTSSSTSSTKSKTTTPSVPTTGTQHTAA